MIIEGAEGQVNLKKLFNECNREYFSGAVPTCKVEWTGRMKNAIGRAHVRWMGPAIKKSPLGKYLPEIPQQNVEINMSSLKIQVSKSFDMSEDDIKGTMLHEMVHILLFSQRKLGGHHGTPEFVGWIKKLSKAAGIRVPLKESEYKPSPKLQAKEGYIMLIWDSSGNIGAATYMKGFIEKQFMTYAQVMSKWCARSSKINKIKLYKAKHKIIHSIPAKRSLSSISWQNIDEETAREIERIGKEAFYGDSQGGTLKGGIFRGFNKDVKFNSKGNYA